MSEVAVRSESRRWLVLSIFCLQSGLVGVLWITFAPIASLSSSFYGVSLGSISLLSMVFMILFLPGILLTSYLMTKWGLRRVVIIGSLLDLVATILRFISVFLPQKTGPLYPAFSVLLLGQSFGALAQPLFITVPVRLANDWFSRDERDAVTVIAAMVNPVGNALGQVVPPLVLSQYPTDKGLIKGFGWLLAGEGVVAVVAFLWACACFAEDPTTAPSRATIVRRSSRQELLQTLSQGRVSSPRVSSPSVGSRTASTDSTFSACDALRALKFDYSTLLKDKNYRILLVAFGMGLGLFNAILTCIEQLVKPANYNSDDAGLFGGVVLLTGLPVAGIVGVVLDRTHAYRATLKAGFAFAWMAVLVFLVLLRPAQRGLVCMGSALLGATTTPMLPVSMETAVECTFPVPEEASGGLLLMAGQVFGVIFTLTLENLLTSGGGSSFEGVWTSAAFFILSVELAASMLVLCYRGQYKRHVSERSDHATEASCRLAPS
mmetsp:Transcript_119284/g.216839  ORF Transcript_119284/g.216839 Transcript_119284/m.216839 type:complete len:491 (-) Transcript_119284:99-1571(-)